MDTVRLDQLYQAILALAGRSKAREDRALGSVHLLKYAYLADAAYAAQHDGRTYTGTPWRLDHYGPWDESARQRIPGVMEALGAIPLSHRGPFADDEVRWWLENPQSDTPHFPEEIFIPLRDAITNHGADLASLLREVYCSHPVLFARPGERLDFTPEVAPASVLEASGFGEPTPAFPELTPARIRRLKRRVRQILSDKKTERRRTRVLPQPPPRYDQVFLEGMTWLDSLAGEPLESQEGRLLFSDAVWDSEARRVPEIP